MIYGGGGKIGAAVGRLYAEHGAHGHRVTELHAHRYRSGGKHGN